MDGTPSTRERLREIAGERFGLRGYEGTSMADLASRVGVRKATLYSHFPSKEALLVELFEESLAGWAAASAPHLVAPGPLEQRLREHLDAALAWVEGNPYAAAIVRVAATQVGGPLGERLRGRLDEISSTYRTELRGVFADAVARRETSETDVESLVELWLVLLEGLVAVAVLDPKPNTAGRARLARVWPRVCRALGLVPETTPVAETSR